MGIAPKHPFRSHGVSLFAIVAVGAALVRTQLHPQGGLMNGSASHYTLLYAHGWPARAVLRGETTEAVWGAPAAKATWVTNTRYQWSISGCLIDGAVCLLILLSTLVVCERLRRRRWRFSVASLMLLAAVAAVVTVLHKNEWAIVHYLNDIVHGTHTLREGLQEPPWYILAPLAAGFGSTVSAVYGLMIRGLLPRWPLFGRRR